MNRPSLQPITLGGVEIRNRTAQSATVSNLAHNLEITDALIAFYEERAKGGIGMIVTEGLSVHPTSQPNGTVPLAYEARMIPGFARIAEAVHRHGAAVVGQLWHVGRQALWNPSLVPWSPSGRRDLYSGTTPHVMTEAEILELVEGFAVSAKNLAEAGFDGVELHGSHGYLITQFLSPESNQRTDRWGGSLENRARFAVELVKACRRATDRPFIVGIKIPADELMEGGLALPDSQEFVAHLVAQARPDYISTGQGNFGASLEAHVPDMRFGETPYVHLPRGIREVADGVPVMAVTAIDNLDTADRVIEEGSADMVGMTRALVADAHLVRKTEAGETPRPCIYCNVCWEYIHTGRKVACIYAPDSGRESEVVTVQITSKPRDVHVVGAGPAGLEFARVALEYGHEVHVHEGSDVTGGRIREESEVPGREIFAKAADWLEAEVRAGGGKISLDDRVAPGEIDADLVVRATGAEPQVDPLPGADTVISLADAIERRDEIPGPVVIIDEIESEPVYAAAEALVAAGLEVTVVTRRAAIGRRVSYISLIGVYRRFDELGVEVRTLAVPVRVEDGVLVTRHPFTGRERPLGPVATVVRAGPFAAPDAGPDDSELLVGDASGPRELLAVVREANAVAHRTFGATDAAALR